MAPQPFPASSRKKSHHREGLGDSGTEHRALAAPAVLFKDSSVLKYHKNITDCKTKIYLVRLRSEFIWAGKSLKGKKAEKLVWLWLLCLKDSPK